MKQYSQTIQSLIQTKLTARNICLKDVTYFECRGRVWFYHGETALLVADVMYDNPITKLTYARIGLAKPKKTVVQTRAAKNKSGAQQEKKKRQKIYERDGFKCLKCGEDRLEELTLDHIVPKSWGGSSKQSNLQTLCKACNFEKGDKNKISYVKKPIFA